MYQRCRDAAIRKHCTFFPFAVLDFSGLFLMHVYIFYWSIFYTRSSSHSQRCDSWRVRVMCVCVCVLCVCSSFFASLCLLYRLADCSVGNSIFTITISNQSKGIRLEMHAHKTHSYNKAKINYTAKLKFPLATYKKNPISCSFPLALVLRFSFCRPAMMSLLAFTHNDCGWIQMLRKAKLPHLRTKKNNNNNKMIEWEFGEKFYLVCRKYFVMGACQFMNWLLKLCICNKFKWDLLIRTLVLCFELRWILIVHWRQRNSIQEKC